MIQTDQPILSDDAGELSARELIELTSADLVSVIIPAFNGLAYISETLESIRSQTYSNLEIIVVDDGSTDGTLEFLQTQPDLTVLQQANQGPGPARNAGAAVAKGRWLAFADCDDVWDPRKLELQLAGIRDSDADMAYTNVRPIGETNELHELQHVPEAMPSGDIFAEVLSDNFITLSSVVMRRSVFIELDGFRTSLDAKGTEDWDLWLRYLGTGREVTAVREPLVLYRWHTGSLSSNVAMMHRSRMLTLDRALQSERGKTLSRAEVRTARAGLLSCSAWFASRNGSPRTVGLYLRSVLSGGSPVEACRGFIRALAFHVRRVLPSRGKP